MRSESFEYFLEIAKCGSFTQASKKLYVSQQGLSKSIKALERDLGCRLFRRDGSRLKLSAAGHALIPYARQCLEDIEMLREAMKPFGLMSTPRRTPSETEVTLYATAFVADSLFLLLDDELQKDGLNNICTIEQTYEEMVSGLSRTTDPALYALGLPLNDIPEFLKLPHVEFKPLFITELMLVGSSQFIHSEKGAFSLDRIAKMPLVYYNDPTLNRLVGDMFKGRILEKVITHAASPSRIMRFIKQGKGVTFVDSLSIYLSEDDVDVSYAPIEDAVRFVVGFAYRKDIEIPKSYLDYIDAFSECFRIRCAPYLEVYPTPTCLSG